MPRSNHAWFTRILRMMKSTADASKSAAKMTSSPHEVLQAKEISAPKSAGGFGSKLKFESVMEDGASIKKEKERTGLRALPRHILVYVGVASMVTFLCGMQAAAFFGSITTIEKAFHFTSTQMG